LSYKVSVESVDETIPGEFIYTLYYIRRICNNYI